MIARPKAFFTEKKREKLDIEINLHVYFQKFWPPKEVIYPFFFFRKEVKECEEGVLCSYNLYRTSN